MKKGLLLVLIAAGFSANAQSLKDMLYGGKLKLDSNTVIRKGDNLTSRIDTTTKKPAAKEPVKSSVVASDKKETAVMPEAADYTIDSVATEKATPEKQTAVPVKSNNKLWKEYTDSLSGELKAEVLTSKKIKKQEYFLTVEYEIGTDGQVSIVNVISSPENEFLQEQVKTRISNTPPLLTPVTDSMGKMRKVKRSYNFTITKE